MESVYIKFKYKSEIKIVAINELDSYLYPLIGISDLWYFYSFESLELNLMYHSVF